jgi:hypothetical protein
MRSAPACPRCVGPLHPPNAWTSEWTCEAHSAVLPLQPARRPSRAGLDALLRVARVPVWLPWPLPTGWLATGFADAGDERTGARACVTALTGPALLAGPADMLLIAEEPGVGLGANLAGLTGPDPGVGFDASPPHAKVRVLGHPVPMWSVAGAPDRAVYAGEALGNWLWAVLWPAEAGVFMLEALSLVDLRDTGMHLDVPFGAFCPHLP